MGIFMSLRPTVVVSTYDPIICNYICTGHKMSMLKIRERGLHLTDTDQYNTSFLLVGFSFPSQNMSCVF